MDIDNNICHDWLMFWIINSRIRLDVVLKINLQRANIKYWHQSYRIDDFTLVGTTLSYRYACGGHNIHEYVTGNNPCVTSQTISYLSDLVVAGDII